MQVLLQICNITVIRRTPHCAYSNIHFINLTSFDFFAFNNVKPFSMAPITVSTSNNQISTNTSNAKFAFVNKIYKFITYKHMFASWCSRVECMHGFAKFTFMSSLCKHISICFIRQHAICITVYLNFTSEIVANSKSLLNGILFLCFKSLTIGQFTYMTTYCLYCRHMLTQ